MKKITSFFLPGILAVLSVKAQNTFPVSGRVGINTMSPVASLQITGGARIGSNTNYINIDSATGNLTFAGTAGYRVANNQFAFIAATAPSVGLFFNATNGRFEFRNNAGNSALNIGADANARVGIGTVSPIERLTIVDALNDKPYIGILGVYANNLTQGVGIGYAGVRAIGTNTNQDLSLNAKNTGNITMQVFGATGNVGIGTLTPSNKLSVNGIADISGNVGIGNPLPNAPLQFANNVANRKIVLYQGPNNDHQFYGVGVNNLTLRYQVDTVAADHVFYAASSSTTSNELMRIKGNGNVTVGTATPATGYLLTVAGKVICTELKVQLQPFPDYVFDKNYALPTLAQVENHINTYHRLPGMPSAAEVETNGMEVGKMQGKVVEKVEEATLYILQLNKENQQLKHQMNDLTKTLAALQQQVDVLKK
ncbi:MAG: hypothetical protein ABI921_01750 [Panacibacter sp.]